MEIYEGLHIALQQADIRRQILHFAEGIRILVPKYSPDGGSPVLLILKYSPDGGSPVRLAFRVCPDPLHVDSH